MAFEFVARNGIIALNNSVITGSLNVSSGITGSLFGTASWASNATTASYVLNAVSASFATSASFASTSSFATTASYVLQAVSASFATSASQAQNATTASYVLNAVSASFASTASFIPTSSLTGNFFVQGGNSFGAQAVLGTNDVQDLAFETSGSVRMTISGSNGNVGIGTTTPTSKLFVFGDNTAGIPALTLLKNVIGGTETIFDVKDGSNGGTTRFMVRADGNVGIGKTSPNATLDVSGSATITGSLNVLGSITTTGTLTAQTLVVQTITSSTDFVTGSTRFGSLLANTHQFTGSVSMTGSLAVTGTGTISTSLTTPLLIGGTTTTSTITYQPTSGVGTTGADHIFKVGNNGATEAMRILNNANVGIGISPTGVNGKLQVTGSIGLSGNSEIRQNTNSDGSTLKILATQFVGANTNSAGYGYSGGGIIAAVAAADSTLLFDAGRTTSTDGRFKVSNTTSSNTSISLEKNGVYTLFASTSGNVGIGTGTPNAKLDISGSLNISGSGVQVPLQVYSGSTPLLFVSQSGNVGIGKIGPAYKLDVSGVIYGLNQIIANNTITDPTTNNTLSNGTVFSLNGVSTNNNFGMGLGAIRNSKYDIWFQTGGSNGGGYRWYIGTSEKMTIDATGNVGIGKTSPNATLDVSGSAIISGSFTVFTGSAVEFQVTNTGTKIGNIITDTHTVTGSLNISGSENIRGSGSAVFSVDGTSGRLFQVDDSLSGSLFSVNTAGGLPVIEAFSDNTVRIGQYGQKALFVSQSRVGIGKETPLNATLDVSGSLNISGSGVQVPLQVSSGSTSLLFVSQSGNVGIGTTSPSGKLHISTSTNSGHIYLSGASQNAMLFRTSANGNGFIVGRSGGSDDGNDFFIYDHASSAFRFNISSSGNVGIGTTSPAYTLDVSGSARVQGGLVAPLLFNRITTTYTLVLADQGKMIEANFGSNSVITVPQNSNVAFPIGTEISIVKRSTGNAQIVGETGIVGVTVNSAGSLDTISTQYGAASLVKVDTNEWYLYGNLT